MYIRYKGYLRRDCQILVYLFIFLFQTNSHFQLQQSPQTNEAGTGIHYFKYQQYWLFASNAIPIQYQVSSIAIQYHTNTNNWRFPYADMIKNSFTCNLICFRFYRNHIIQSLEVFSREIGFIFLLYFENKLELKYFIREVFIKKK